MCPDNLRPDSFVKYFQPANLAATKDMSSTPGNDGGSGNLPDCELKDGFVLDDQSFPTFLKEQCISPLPRTLVAKKQIRSENKIIIF